MMAADARRTRAYDSILALLATAPLAACGSVGVGNGGQTLTTAAPGSGATAVSVSAPQAPTISGTPAANAMVGAVYSFQPSVSHGSSKKIAFAITNKPSWATFNDSTGQLVGTPGA